MKTKNKNNLIGYFLIMPWFIGFVLMFFLPMCASFYYSFTNYNMLKAPEIIGLDNYVRMFNDAVWWNSLKVTLKYVFLVVPLRLSFALFVAMLLAQPRKGGGIYRTIYYIPSVIGGSVAVAIIWKQIFGNPGVIMTLMNNMGFDVQTSLLGSQDTALYTIVLLAVWQFGASMLIFLAALKQVPGTLYEAADIEGVSFWGKFINITLPMITPTIFFNLILQIINGFKAFNEAYIITSGGPNDSTMFYVLNLYNRAFRYFDMGYSSAMAWFLLAMICLLSGIVFATQNKWVYYESKGGK